MAAVQSANLALRFLLELAALVAFGYWGFRAADGTLPRIALGIGVPLVVLVIWATAISPNRSLPLSEPVAFVLGLVVLGLAAAALVGAGRAVVGVAFAAVAVANAFLMVIWQQ